MALSTAGSLSTTSRRRAAGPAPAAPRRPGRSQCGRHRHLDREHGAASRPRAQRKCGGRAGARCGRRWPGRDPGPRRNGRVDETPRRSVPGRPTRCPAPVSQTSIDTCVRGAGSRARCVPRACGWTALARKFCTIRRSNCGSLRTHRCRRNASSASAAFVGEHAELARPGHRASRATETPRRAPGSAAIESRNIEQAAEQVFGRVRAPLMLATVSRYSAWPRRCASAWVNRCAAFSGWARSWLTAARKRDLGPVRLFRLAPGQVEFGRCARRRAEFQRFRDLHQSPRCGGTRSRR